MTLRNVYIGEDVPITVDYYDSAGDPVDPDDQDTSGDPDADITITAPSGTAVVSDVAMTDTAVGSFEYVWDTGTDNDGEGTYTVSITTEFDTETKIDRTTIVLEE